MSEAEKKGSPWPWFLVPIAAVILFFVLRECRSHLPPADHATTPATAPDDSAAAAAPETPPAPQQ